MTIRLTALLAALGIAALSLAACSDNKSAQADAQSSSVDQSSVCVASTDQQAENCPAGKLIFARVKSSDPSARPLRVMNTIAVYCNTNDPIIKNSAGVICVLTKARLKQFTGHAAASSSDNQSQNAANSTGSQ